MAQVPRESPMLRPVKRRVSSSSDRRAVRRRVAYGPAYKPRMFHFPSYYGDQPHRKFARLKYSCHVTIAGVPVGAISETQFRANGMYDPEVGLGGHQPYGFDQLMAQYFHYTVISSTCKVEMLTAGSHSPQIWMLMLYNSTGVPSAAYAAGGVNGLRELPVVSKTLALTDDAVPQQQFRSQKLRAYMPKVFGKTAANMIGDARFQGDAASDPAEDCYFGLVGYVPNGVVSEIGSFWNVEITYDAVFTEPRFFTTS